MPGFMAGFSARYGRFFTVGRGVPLK
jgi:hypothetical protein